MFNSLSGTVSGGAGDTLYLSTGGVEWELMMPLSDIGALGPAGGEARVFTWLYHTEKDMRLYGFSSAERRTTFMELQKVDGIGPRAALRIMSGIGQAELERALEEGDVARLEQVPGLGKKTAQKMVLALKGRLVQGGGTKAAASSPYGELVDALAGMGYDRKAAAAALEQAEAALSGKADGQRSGAERESELFRLAILKLTK
ncbi:MAG: Holliday junction branch migration protein RuvA [Spirochaetaceae bacterium]|jgi:Holliday junction DNA helicase RuvA|nr:Holliday junction branch migration protein RuvA [Spirochaetaceae bacterium]